MIARACRLAHDTEAKAILCITNSGYTAFRLSAHRPKIGLYIFISDKAVGTEMGLLWGANVFYYDAIGKDLEATVKGMTDALKGKGLLKVGDTYITTLSIPANKNLKTNTVQLGTVE